MMINLILAYTYLFLEIMDSNHLLRPVWHHSFLPVIYSWRVCQHMLTWSTTHPTLFQNILHLPMHFFLLMPSEDSTLIFPYTVYSAGIWHAEWNIGRSLRMLFLSSVSLLLTLFKPSKNVLFLIFFIKNLPFKNALDSNLYSKWLEIMIWLLSQLSLVLTVLFKTSKDLFPQVWEWIHRLLCFQHQCFAHQLKLSFPLYMESAWLVSNGEKNKKPEKAHSLLKIMQESCNQITVFLVSSYWQKLLQCPLRSSYRYSFSDLILS